uniref:Succinate dehydrogenase subunit 3 n=1 Tax=Lotus japonicus TaxID=34305 RepID=I3SJ95_LOTJA|nr:unknown [Lotus japonicus]
MSLLLRSTKSKLFSSSLSRTFSSLHRTAPPQIGATTATGGENTSRGNLTGLPKDSNDFSSLRFNAYGLDATLLAGARYGTKACAANGPMQMGVMARSFQRGAGPEPLGLTSHKRFMSDTSSKTTETKPYGLRPLSPHLPVYQPQLSSTLSIFNRIAGASLAAIIVAFYMIYMKMGLISLTYDSFYQFVFYSSKLNLLAIEISALATTYHLYSAIRHLLV